MADLALALLHINSVLRVTRFLQELPELEVGFVSITEAIDLTTPNGRATAGLLAVFAEFERELLRERVKSCIAQVRKKRHAARSTADDSTATRQG